MLWLALLALSLIATLFFWAACAVASNADDTLDYSADEIADAGDVYLAGMARGAAKAASAGGETLAADSGGVVAFGSSHDGDR